MFDASELRFWLSLLVLLATITTIYVGYLIGVARTRRYYHNAYRTLSEQLHYWRHRYFQTLQDYQDLAEEKQWIKDWCPDDDDV